MNVFQLFGEEVKAIVSKPKNIIFMLAVMCIPLLYAGMFLYAFWNAYGMSGHLPVAVVNQDQGTTLDGKHLNAGNDLVSKLKKDNHFDWQFVSNQKATDGFENNRYFMIVRIPAGFSKNATTLVDKTVKPANLYYQINADYNFVAAKMVGTGLNTLKADVSTRVTKLYAQSMYAQLDKLSRGLGAAAQGSKDLAKGGGQEVAGLNQLKSGFKSLMNGTNQLADGSGQLTGGTAKLNAGLKTAANGTNQLYNQTSSNSDNIAKLADGANSLANHLDQLNKGAVQLANGSGQLSTDSGTIVSNMNQYLTGLNQFQTGLQQEETGLARLNKQVTTARPQINALVTAIHQLNTGAGSLASGISQLAPVSKEVAQGVNQLVSVADGLPSIQEIDALKTNSTQLSNTITGILGQQTGDNVTVPRSLLSEQQTLNSTFANINIPSIDQSQIRQLQQGANALDKAFNTSLNGGPSLVSGSQALKTGLNALDSQSSVLTTQSTQLTSGVAQLASGMSKLSSGQQALQANFIKLVDGEARLSSGMTMLQANLAKLPNASAALTGGANQIASGNVQLSQTWPQLVGGIQSLQTGTNQLVSGSNQLAANLNTLNSGISSLSNGQDQLAGGTNQLAAGTQKIYNGNKTLGSNLSGAHSQLAGTPTDNAHAAKFSQPVTAIDGTHQSVDTFGSGFVPYFISLAFFIGALILTIIYNLGRPAGLSQNGAAIALSKFFVATLMSIGSSFLIDLTVLKGLGLSVSHPWTFVGFSVLTSATFMAIILFLAGTFGNVGQFIALVILILQFVTCSGAYTVQLIPSLIQPVARILPMTYSVAGFRNIIDGHQQAMLAQNALILAGFLVSILVLSMISFTVKFHLNNRPPRTSASYRETTVES